MSDLLAFFLTQGEQFRRARLSSLYSDFSLQRSSNPDGYEANVSAWVQALSKAAQAGLLPEHGSERDRLSLKTGEVLLKSLETKEWGRPLALETVIGEAVSRRQMVPYQEFLSSRKSIYQQSWTVRPWGLLSWALKQIGLSHLPTPSRNLLAGRFVFVHNVEEAASKIVEHLGNESNRINRIYPLSIFRSEVTRILDIQKRLTEGDLNVILVYLTRDKSLITYDHQTVKFLSPADTSSTLSPQDKIIASLKVLLADLNRQTALLTSSIPKLSETARVAVKAKNRNSALAALRSKKLNETALDHKTAVLSQVEGLYGKLEQAADQITVLRVMEASAGVLRNLNAEAGGIENVEKVVEGVKDEVSKVDEISSAIEAGGQANDVIDEDGIDEELEYLEMQAKTEESEKEARLTKDKLASIDDIGNVIGVNRSQPEKGLSSTQSSPQTPDKVLEKGVKALNLSLGKARPGPTCNTDELCPPLAERAMNVAS